MIKCTFKLFKQCKQLRICVVGLWFRAKNVTDATQKQCKITQFYYLFITTLSLYVLADTLTCVDYFRSSDSLSQGDHLSGKPGNVREFDSCQGNVRDFTKSQGNVRGKSCQGKAA